MRIDNITCNKNPCSARFMASAINSAFSLWWYPARLILSRFWLGSQLLGISSSAEGRGGGRRRKKGGEGEEREGGGEGGGEFSSTRTSYLSLEARRISRMLPHRVFLTTGSTSHRVQTPTSSSSFRSNLEHH